MSDIKPVLRQMIDNNKPHWRTATIRGAHKMLDEYEAKAKSWDKLMFEIDEINDEVAGKELPSKIIMAAKITALSNVIKEHESGGSDA